MLQFCFHRNNTTFSTLKLCKTYCNQQCQKGLKYIPIFFYFHWHYSPLWALACRTMSIHFFLSATNTLHLFTPSTWRSLSTSSFHLFLYPHHMYIKMVLTGKRVDSFLAEILRGNLHLSFWAFLRSNVFISHEQGCCIEMFSEPLSKYILQKICTWLFAESVFSLDWNQVYYENCHVRVSYKKIQNQKF
jgi:hypothetical protein